MFFLRVVHNCFYLAKRFFFALLVRSQITIALMSEFFDLSGVYDYIHDAYRSKSLHWVCGIVVGIALLVTLIVCMALGIHSLEQSELAYTNNQITGSLDGPYEQGLHFFNPADQVIFADRTILTVNLTVACFTWDKMSFIANVTVLYAYDPDKIVEVVIKLFSSEANYVISLNRNMTQSVMWSSAKFNATDYYDIRGVVEKQMQLDLQQNMNSSNSRSAVLINSLQLTNISFPAEFAAIIVERQLIEQQRVTALNNRPSALTNANTTYLKAFQQASIITTNYDNQARIIMANAEAQAQVIQANWMSLAYTLNYTKTINDWNNSQVIDFLNQDSWTNKETVVDFGALSTN